MDCRKRSGSSTYEETTAADSQVMEERRRTYVRYLQQKISFSYGTFRHIIENSLHIRLGLFKRSMKYFLYTDTKAKNSVSDSWNASIMIMGLWKELYLLVNIGITTMTKSTL